MMLKLVALLGALMLAYAVPDRLSCVDQDGLTYTACHESLPGAGDMRSRGGGLVKDRQVPDAELLNCCEVRTYSGTDKITYEFARGTWDLIILCAHMGTDEVITIKPINCDDGSCAHARLDQTATYPIKIAMKGPHFHFSSGAQFMVKFFATNNAYSSCTCGSVCAEGWLQFGDYCYKRTEDTRNFDPQDQHCASLNDRALLASIHSYEENQFIKNEFVANAPTSGIWVGLYDPNNGDLPRAWTWTDCSAFNYQNWHNNEPNDYQGNEDCMQLRQNQDYNWNDISCSYASLGICKYFLPAIAPASLTTLSCCSVENYRGSDRACYRYLSGDITIVVLCARMMPGEKIRVQKYPCTGAGCYLQEIDENTVFPLTITANIADDFTFYSDGKEYSVEFLVAKHDASSCNCPDSCATGWERNGDYCYSLTPNSGGFHDMDGECSTLQGGAHLTSITSAAEENFILTTFTTNTPNEDRWIGLTDTKYGITPRKWRWTDCSAYSYTNWNGNEPNDYQLNEDCGHLFEPFGYKWNDVACTRNIKGICKYYMAHIP